MNNLNNISKKCSIWKLPETIEMTTLADDSSFHTLKQVDILPVDNIITLVKIINYRQLLFYEIFKLHQFQFYPISELYGI